MRAPLSLVVTDAVKRWYIDTNKEAVKGDVVCDQTSGLSTAVSLDNSTVYAYAAEATSSAGTDAAGRLWL